MIEALNILVTGCGGDIGQSIGKILVKSVYTNKLFGIDISDKNPAQFIYPNFSIGLPFTNPNYLSKLELFIKENEIDVIIPIAEPELRFFSNKNILDKISGAKMITASAVAMKVGFDKFKTAVFLEKENLPFPVTHLAVDVKKIVRFPVILKSKTGSGSKSVHKINTFEEFLFYTRKDIDDFVLQEYLPETNGEYTCGLFRSKHGEIRSIILKRELQGGYSGYGEVVENTAVSTLLEQLADKLDLVGSINVQLRIAHQIPLIFEINPRFSSTVLFRQLFGFEDLLWSIEDKMGWPLSPYVKNNSVKKFYKGFQEYMK
jgi:carbamoyl-phosphate synthase large subunit